MAANPPLWRAFDNSLIPTPYAMETIALQRGGIEFLVDGVRTHNGKCATPQNDVASLTVSFR
jgi:hypothetical protein